MTLYYGNYDAFEMSYGINSLQINIKY